MLGALALAALVPLVLLYQRTWSNNERRRRREVYSDDDDALLLNLAEPQTRWFNMGYWDTHTDSFPDACAQLCRKVAQAARLEPHQRICVRPRASCCFVRCTLMLLVFRRSATARVTRRSCLRASSPQSLMSA